MNPQEELELLELERERAMPETKPVEVPQVAQPAPVPDQLAQPEDQELELLSLERERAMSMSAAKPEAPTDFGSQVAMGIKESVLPFTIDKEEYEAAQPKSASELAARIIANIATDIGTTAAAGAIAGTLVVPAFGTAAGAIAGTTAGVVLGVYRALGYESVMSEVEERDFSIGKAAVNVAVEVNPMLKIAGTGAKVIQKAAVKGTLQGGLQYAQAKQYGAGEGHALLAAGIGGGLVGGSALIAPYIVNKGLSSKATKDTLEALNEDGKSMELARKASELMTKDLPAEEFMAKNFKLSKASDPKHFDELYEARPDLMVQRITPVERKAVKAMLTQMSTKEHPTTGKKITLDISEEVVEKEAARLRFVADAEETARIYVPKSKKDGEELIAEAVKAARATGLSEAEAFKMHRTNYYLSQAIAEEAEASTSALGLKEPITNNLFEEASALLYVANATEHVTGLSITKTVSEMAKAKNLHNNYIIGLAGRVKKIVKDADKVKLPRQQISVLLEVPMEKVPKQYQPVIRQARAVFDDMRDDAISKGVTVDKLENYFTQMTVAPEVALARVRNALSQYSTPEIINATTGPANDLRRILSAAGDTKLTAENFNDAVKKFEASGINKLREGFEANASFARHGAVPSMIRERDFGRTVLAYANNLNKSATIDPIIKKFQSIIPLLDQLGFKRSSKYWRKYIADMSGHPSEGKALKLQQETQYKAALIQEIEFGDVTGIKKLSLNARLYASDMLGFGMSQFYPNFLGWRLDAPARNLAQTMLMTAPEIGGGGVLGKMSSAYGVKLAVQAWSNLLLNPAKFKAMEKELHQSGYFAGKFIGEGAKEYERSLRSTIKFLDLPIRAVEKINAFGMWLYGKSDTINRYMTKHMGSQLAKDIAAGAPETKMFIKRLPEGLRFDISQSVKAKDLAKTEQLVTDFLISKTQLNYGRHAMHQFGREHGTLTSMFTTWPSHVGSDIYVSFKHRGTGAFDLTQKLLAPLAGLYVLQQIRSESEVPPQLEAFMKPNLLVMSPLLSVQVGTPPPIEAGYRTARAVKSYAVAAWKALEGDMEAAEAEFVKGTEQLGEGLGSTLPAGYGIIKGAVPTAKKLMGETEE